MAAYGGAPLGGQAPSLGRSISADMAEKCKLQECTRRSCNGQGGHCCCLECEQSGGETHSSICDSLEVCVQKAAVWRKALQGTTAEKLSKFVEGHGDSQANSSRAVAGGDELVDTDRLGTYLAKVYSESWTKDRLGELFRIMAVDRQDDGRVRFSDLCSWVSCTGPEKDLSAFSMGSTPQNIGVRITASPSGGSFAQRVRADVPKGFLFNVSRETRVGELAEALSLWLGMPTNSIVLTSHDGVELTKIDESLQANDITLPGPAARRKGEKLELNFGINPSDLTPTHEAFMNLLDDEIWKAGKSERDLIAKHRGELIRSMKTTKEKEEELRTAKDPDFELDEYVCQKIGVNKEKFDELNANPRLLEEWLEAGNVHPDMNYLVEVTDRQAIKIISDCLGKKVIRLYRNENQILQHRYTTAKERLRNCGRSIGRENTNTQGKITGVPPLDHLGPFDPSLNEYPMWHGTGREGVSGICRSNFDIQRAGTHGLAYGTGFYFADDPGTSVSYSSMSGGGNYVNRKYPKCAFMLLNRVMCGNIKHFDRLPHSRQEFDMWTADCIGSGGVWAGADAKYECIRSPGTFCWVAVHSHQIYPAYLIIYEI
eukprot:TRINITY_DN72092_c0_g1_i1.p1 TRINITY_DN72092_c0_g1~~TRINITY_DN72092_c0_g1_i1.p1  ORF type:complete len:599 (+),score=86.62 TRINITY_DN72092_c0_g1_i1:30-1826(+)